MTYKEWKKTFVDGKHVILKPSDKERAVAAILSGQYGKQVEHVPQIMYPQGIQTPDYLIDGERFDLKCFFKSAGKNVIYNLISKKKNQSPNFIASNNLSAGNDKAKIHVRI